MSRGLLTLDHHFHLPLLGTNDYRLLAHPPHHVEGTLRLPAQGQFQRILLQASLDDLPQFLDNGEEAIRRAQSLQRLMWPLVVVVLHPQPHPLARRLETVELGPHQELFPDGLPEPFDLAQGHGMVRPALDVVNPILAPLRLEAGRPAPTGVRAAFGRRASLGAPRTRPPLCGTPPRRAPPSGCETGPAPPRSGSHRPGSRSGRRSCRPDGR